MPKEGLEPSWACAHSALNAEPAPHLFNFLVGTERVELSCLAAYAPEAYVSANSTTSPGSVYFIDDEKVRGESASSTTSAKF